MRISDWSSDVCSSDLPDVLVGDVAVGADHEGFRDAVDAPVDADAAVPIGTGPRVGISQLVQPAGGILRPVPVVEAVDRDHARRPEPHRSEEHTSELQSLMRISSAVFCLKKKKTTAQLTVTQSLTSTHS